MDRFESGYAHCSYSVLGYILTSNKVDIFCLQEVELENGFSKSSLSICGFDLLMAEIDTIYCFYRFYRFISFLSIGFIIYLDMKR